MRITVRSILSFLLVTIFYVNADDRVGESGSNETALGLPESLDERQPAVYFSMLTYQGVFKVMVPLYLMSKGSDDSTRSLKNLLLHGIFLTADGVQKIIQMYLVQYPGMSDIATAGIIIGLLKMRNRVVSPYPSGTSVMAEAFLISALSGQAVNGIDKIVVIPVADRFAPSDNKERSVDSKIVSQIFRSIPLLIVVIPSLSFPCNSYTKSAVIKGIYESAVLMGMIVDRYDLQVIKPLFHFLGVRLLAQSDGADGSLQQTYDVEAQEQLGFHLYLYITEGIQEFFGDTFIFGQSVGLVGLDYFTGRLLSPNKQPYIILSPSSVRDGMMTAAIFVSAGYLDSWVQQCISRILTLFTSPDDRRDEL